MGFDTRIRVKDLTVWYAGHLALNHVSVDIPDRRITAVIGPSGCGKTTFLKSLNRLIELQQEVKVAGQVLIDGEDIYGHGVEVTHLRKKVGLLLQRPQVLPMSIYENVAYGPRIHGTRNRRQLQQTVEQYLRESSLWDEVKDRLHTPASRLSIGQQQRLCLARALAVEPEVILGDEPTSALDPISAERIEQKLQELKGRYSVVLVTHSLRQAQRLADEVMFFYLGDLIEHGPADQVFHRPQFQKTKNYLSGRFIEEPKIHRELDLRQSTAQGEAIRAVGGELATVAYGEVLKILGNELTVADGLPNSLRSAGHEILEIRRLNKTDWEILVHKGTDTYAV